MVTKEDNGLVIVSLVFVSYFLGAELSHIVSFSETFASIWIASGVGLAFYTFYPFKKWPLVMTGVVLANLLSDIGFHEKTFGVSLGFCFANSLEAMTGALMLRKLARKGFDLGKPRNVWVFLLLVGSVSPAIGASIGAWVVHSAFGAPYGEVWRIWWSGDAIGMIVAFPIVWMSLTSIPRSLEKLVEKAPPSFFWFLLICQCLVTYYIFGLQEQTIAYLALILPVIITARYSDVGAVSSIFLTSLIGSYVTAQGLGLFGSHSDLNQRATLLHLFLTSMTATCLSVNLVVSRELRQTLLLEQANRQLEDSEERFALAVEGASVGIWDWKDLSADKSYWSDKFYKLIGYLPSEIDATIANFQSFLIHPDDIESATKAGDELIVNRKEFDIEYRLKTKAGEYRWFRATAVVSRDEAGNPTRMVGSIQDIHERKLTEQKLLKTNTDLEQFAYIASHDLKAPLRGISNLISFLKDELEELQFDSKEIRDNMKLIERQIRMMQNLIAGLLEFAQTGKDLNPSMINVYRVAEDVIAGLPVPEGMVIQNNLIDGDILTDEVRFAQVLSNLISNGIKYHHAPKNGLIRLTQKDAGDFIEVSVEDNGPGIDPKFHKKIFGMFQTLVPKDKVESSGIGLSLVETLVTGRGGTIKVDSEPGQGASFIFTWPKKDESLVA